LPASAVGAGQFAPAAAAATFGAEGTAAAGACDETPPTGRGTMPHPIEVNDATPTNAAVLQTKAIFERRDFFMVALLP
jgi:hypothetical protein